MPNRCQSSRRPTALLGLALSLVAAACQSANERREQVEIIEDTWITTIPEGSLAELTGLIRDLGELEPSSAEAAVTVPLLAREVLSSPSALVRADALRAGWQLAGPWPVEALTASPEPAPEFNAWMGRFEELDGHAEQSQGAEIQELAQRIGNYRFPPSQVRYAVELASVAVVRAYQRRPSPVQAVFARVAPGCARHALVLVTIQAANDSEAYVREEALRATHYLAPDTAFKLLGASLSAETDPLVLFALLDSVEALGRAQGAEVVAPLLEYAARSSDASVRRRAERITKELEA